MSNKPIWDADGLVIGGKRKKGIHFVKTPEGDLIAVPKGIHADELFADDEPASDLRAFAKSCLLHSALALIGTGSRGQILGCKLLQAKKVTPAVVRRAARLAIISRWKDVTLATSQEISQEAREAAMLAFDVCLLNVTLLVEET